MNEEKRARGVELLAHMLGSEHFADDPLTEHSRYLRDFTTEEIFGGLWQRPGLDLKTRSLCTLTSLISLARPESSLRNHVRGALANGATEQEILEVVVHSAFYAGFPAVVDALAVVTQVLAEASSLNRDVMRSPVPDESTTAAIPAPPAVRRPDPDSNVSSRSAP